MIEFNCDQKFKDIVCLKLVSIDPFKTNINQLNLVHSFNFYLLYKIKFITYLNKIKYH